MELLEKNGVEVVYPMKQSCCGQPMANSGYENYGEATSELFLKNFGDFEYIVAPSGSCTLHVKDHVLPRGAFRPQIFELCEFLTDVLKVETIHASFPYKVGIHSSCHGLRGLGLAKPSEIMATDFDKPKSLLEKVQGINIVQLARKDECCGFGGTFSVTFPHISKAMGEIKIEQVLARLLAGNPLADVIAFGAEHSTLQQLIEPAVAAEDFALTPDPVPEEVLFIRSDQYSFVRQGLPSVFLVPGFTSMDPQIDGAVAFQEHLATHYHRPSDDSSRPVDWNSALRFARANVRIGSAIADADERPHWNEGDFFGERFARPATTSP